MQCPCGNDMHNIPEHLQDLGNWICQKCANNGRGAPRPKYKRADGKDVRVPMPVMQPGKGRK